MTTNDQHENAPFYLFQVLEDEYQTLHGSLPKAYEIRKREIENTIKEKAIDKSKNEQELNEAVVPELYRHIHEKKPAALCLSGGGIRSATFGLGVLQGLARRGLLDQFHYLSTVSGGGYVGSWLTSWIRRKGLPAVLAELRDPPKSKLDPEPNAIRYLREYSNYLTPQLGALSADTWTLIATYLRNLFVNWFVWLPLLLVALMFPRFLVALSSYDPRNQLWPVAILLGVGFVHVTLALAYISLNLPSVRKELGDYDHFFKGRDSQGSFLIWCLAPLLISAFLLTTAWAWLRNPKSSLLDQLSFGHDLLTATPLVTFIVIGAFVHLFGWLMAIGVLLLGKSGKEIQGRRNAIGRFWGAYHFTEIIAIGVSGAVGGVATWVLATKIFPSPSDELHVGSYVCFAAPLLLFSFLIGGAVYVGLASRWTSDDDREWWARSSGWILISLVAWMGLGGIVVFGPLLLLEIPNIVIPLGGVTGLLTLLLGFSAKTIATSDQTENGGWQALAMKIAPVLAAPVAILSLAAFLSLLTGWVIHGVPVAVQSEAPLRSVSTGFVDHGVPGIVAADADTNPSDSLPGLLDPATHRMVLHHTDGLKLLALTVVLILVAVPMGLLINVNKFSLHSIYRNRLVRAYLGASNEKRDPNPFTGFDPQDNIEMYQCAPDSASPASGPRLLHIVNIALNLVGKKKEKLAWQERKAESFTISSSHVGNWQLGYRRTEDYGKSKKGEAIKLGTAISISGAAASPNMGYHSSPAVTFLMTLFNIRLGWWLGNPGKAGGKTFDKSSPTFSIGPMINEALGFTNDEYPYVYLSDGGHFENLGLYEMVLRRCRFILAIDSGRDPECAFEDLGNAIRKVRIDLGIPITFQKVRIYPRPKGAQKPDDIPKYCAIGEIGYKSLDQCDENGILLYIKPALAGDEPTDIYNYAQTNPGFPHESTGDQWFSESQFESYRMLGSHITEQICGKKEEWDKNWEDNSKKAPNVQLSRLEFFHAQVGKYLKPPSDQDLASKSSVNETGVTGS